MKVSGIFVVLATISVAVRGWAAILHPIALSIGAAFAALNLDSDLLPEISMRNWNPFTKDHGAGCECPKCIETT